jgi:hypothetical protein
MREMDANGIKCPGCSGALRPKVMTCDTCDVQVEGHFSMGVWAHLNESQLNFVQLFMRCEGNIRDMEKALGISYPTVKAQLAEINARLGEVPKPVSQRLERPRMDVAVAGVLNDLRDGHVSYEEALNLIRQQGGKNAR